MDFFISGIQMLSYCILRPWAAENSCHPALLLFLLLQCYCITLIILSKNSAQLCSQDGLILFSECLCRKVRIIFKPAPYLKVQNKPCFDFRVLE